MKVALNPRHFGIRARAQDGTIWLTHERHMAAVLPVKDVTDAVLLALCADLSAGDETQRIERTVRFSDGMKCRMTVEMISAPN